jgi:hypothetical protein
MDGWILAVCDWDFTATFIKCIIKIKNWVRNWCMLSQTNPGS